MVEQRQKGGGANRWGRPMDVANTNAQPKILYRSALESSLMVPLGGQTSEKSCRVVHRASGSLSLRQGWH